MWRSINLVLAVLMACYAWPNPAVGQSSPFSLHKWINQESGAKLADKLANHPKFKGQALRIGAIVNGKPSLKGNELIKSVQDQLVHHILARGKNDILTDASSTCPHLQDAHYYLGISIRPVDKLKHRVQIAVFDLDTRRWLSGISYTWQGRLNPGERAAFKRLSPDLQHSPFQGLDDPALAHFFARQLNDNCGLSKAISGHIYVQTHTDAKVQKLLANLTDHLRTQSWPVTDTPGDADWLVSAQLKTGSSRVYDEVQLRLHNTHLNRRSDIVAQVVKPSSKPDPEPKLVTAAHPAQNLIRNLKTVKDKTCRRCTTISVELKHPAHMLIFTTREQTVIPLSCSSSLPFRSPGAYQFRVQPTTSISYHRRPSTGFYVLAGTDKNIMDNLQEQLRAASPSCNRQGHSHTGTLTAFMQAITQAEPHTDWRAVHVQNRKYGTVKL